MPDRHRNKVTGVRLNPQEKVQLQYLADIQGKTITQVVREALRVYSQQFKAQQEILTHDS